MANLSYIRNFCFSHSSKDELSYCLSTFEAAVEYINLGKLHDSPAVGVTRTRTHKHTHTHPGLLFDSVTVLSGFD